MSTAAPYPELPANENRDKDPNHSNLFGGVAEAAKNKLVT
jgi:hypothetical protein